MLVRFALIILLPLVMNVYRAPNDVNLRMIAHNLPVATSITRTAKNVLLLSTKDGRVLALDAAGGYTTAIDLRNMVNDYMDRGLSAARVRPGTDDIYLAYVAETPQNDTDQVARMVVSKFNLTDHSLVALTSNGTSSSWGWHTTADIIFFDGAAYASFGDGQNSADPATIYAYETGSEFNGKIVNIDTMQIYARGFRNPWRMAIISNTIYAVDVGWNRFEEIDAVHEGGDYGWPCFEALSPYYACTGNFVAPVVFYDHSLGEAVTALAFYNGEMVFADFGQKWIRNSAFQLLARTTGGIVDMQVIEGCLFAVSIEDNGTSSVLSTCG